MPPKPHKGTPWHYNFNKGEAVQVSRQCLVPGLTPHQCKWVLQCSPSPTDSSASTLVQEDCSSGSRGWSLQAKQLIDLAVPPASLAPPLVQKRTN